MTKDEFLAFKEENERRFPYSDRYAAVSALIAEVERLHPEWVDKDVKVTLKLSEWKAVWDLWYRSGNASLNNVTRELGQAAKYS